MLNLKGVKERYTKGAAHQIYGEGAGVRQKVCDYIVKEFPKAESFFEFGCSAGYNLNRIKEKIPDALYMGIDINETAITKGKDELKLRLRVADETYLDFFDDNAFDVVFTSSVLNHLPDWNMPGIFANLQRIAKHVICMEGNVNQEPDFYIHGWEEFGFKNVVSAGKGTHVVYDIWRWDK